MCQNHLFYFCTNAYTILSDSKDGLDNGIFFNTKTKTISRIKGFWTPLTERSRWEVSKFHPPILLGRCVWVKHEQKNSKKGEILRPLNETSQC